MSKGLVFWIIMLLWLLSALWFHWGTFGVGAGFHLIIWILLALVGWQIFGPPIR